MLAELLVQRAKSSRNDVEAKRSAAVLLRQLTNPVRLCHAPCEQP